MRAGRLDRRVTLRTAVKTQSPSGEVVSSWADLATVWGEFVPVDGAERYVNQQLGGRALATFRIRYSSITRQLTVKDRLFVDGREYDITDVREPQRREELEIDAFARSEQQVSTGPDLLDNVIWVPLGLTILSGPTSLTLTEDFSGGAHFADTNIAGIQPAGLYNLSFDYKPLGPTLRVINFGIWDNDSVPTGGWTARIRDPANPSGTIEFYQTYPGDFILSTITAVSGADGWVTFNIQFTVNVPSPMYLFFNMALAGSPIALGYTGDGSAVGVRNGRLVKL